MKFKHNQKLVMFYGNILHVNADVVYLAVDDNGDVFAHTSEPSIVQGEWMGEYPYGYSTGLMVTFEEGESWKDTLTNCKDEGQDWMLALKTKIAVEYALLEAGAIPQQKALSNVIDSFPLGESFLNQHWDAFRKHSGVENVASKEFLNALEAVFAAPLFIEAEKFVYPEDDSLLIRDYYGTGLIIPRWAKFIAMGNDGRVRAYEAQPEVVEGDNYNGTWSTYGIGKAFIVGWRSGNTAGDKWRNSLREVRL